MRSVAGVLAALGVLFIGAALLRPTAEGEQPDLRDRFEVRVQDADGAVAKAAVVCEGDIVGTGYLADAERSHLACTFDTTVAVHRYLQHGRSACSLLLEDAAGKEPRSPLAEATITGVYFDAPITRRIDAVDGDACDRAAWTLLAPLLP